MKKKLTTLLFGLLLAVGWTSSAFAQTLPSYIPAAVHDKAYYQQHTYSWTDEETGVTYNDVDPTVEATNAYQIYELVRFVYGNPYFPGPTYSAFLPSINGAAPQPERVVEYEAFAGGWGLRKVTMNEGDPYEQGTVAAPFENGYTVLVVSVNNTTRIEPENNYYQGYYVNGSTWYTQKSEVITYIKNNIKSVKLLTDGLRIGSYDDYSSGTVFNCDGEYNKFFFLGKGQARKKTQRIMDLIGNGDILYGDAVIFENLFEEFSPTGGNAGDQITDFYDRMTEGSVYNVEHDCSAVIQMGHQFSMSGNSGTTAYPMSGLNFFVPDYRLLYWVASGSGNYAIDGRDMNADLYSTANTGKHNSNSTYNNSVWSVNYANYNKEVAPPKVGIYFIHLEAEAKEVAQVHEAGNLNYEVTLTWTSSLNEMSGKDVPQTYTVYYYDADGNLQYVEATGITNGETGLTTVSYLVEQREHGYMIEYIIKGRPNDSDHPAFVAWSNTDGVVIPGWADFVGLDLEHFESDFDTQNVKNWYRNFLLVKNDVGDGLTVDKVSGGMNTFSVYRYLPSKDEQGNDIKTDMKEIATLSFSNPTDQQVNYTVNYVADLQKIYPYDLKNSSGQVVQANAYERANMDIPDQGIVRVKGNGDIVIWPNGYWVNFKSIKVYNGNSTSPVTQWNAPSSATGTSPLPSTMKMSDGSVWEPYTTDANDRVYYIEGGGYIYIPNMLNNSSYSNLRVEIEAYNDGANTAKITVNDVPQNIGSTKDKYTWNSPSPHAFHAPRATETKTYSYTFTNNPFNVNGGTVTLGDISWNSTLTWGNAGSSTNGLSYENTRGAQLGSRNNPLRSFTLSTSQIPGTIKLIKVGANAYTSSATIGVTVGGEAFGTTQNLTSGTTAGTNTFTGEASGNVVITLTNPNNGGRSLYIKSIEITYEVDGGNAQTGLLRLALPIVDQFNVDIPDDNKHPSKYGYVLKYKPDTDDEQESGSVEVPVLHTEASVNGFFTEAQVMADTDLGSGLTKDVMEADVTLNLPQAANPTPKHVRLHGGLNKIPSSAAEQLSILERRTDGKYREMDVTSPLYVEQTDFAYPAGKLDYFNKDEETQGQYSTSDANKFFVSYATSITADGKSRRYWEYDGLDNSYGAPIWKTGVGKVDEISGNVEQASKSWWSTWTYQDNGTDVNCTLYRAALNLKGYLPNRVFSNVEYEPFMFRVWAQCDNMRKFKVDDATGRYVDDGPVVDTEGNPTNIQLLTVNDINGISVEGTPTENDICSIQYGKVGDLGNGPAEYPAANELVFGAPVNSEPKYIIRFYYRSTGHGISVNNRAEVPMYYVAEGEFTPDEIPTGVVDLKINGEVVSKTYINAQGMKSDKPFNGVNIVVTRYSDGTVVTTKEVKY